MLWKVGFSRPLVQECSYGDRSLRKAVVHIKLREEKKSATNLIPREVASTTAL
jgi:hypothetical protein